MPVPTTTTDGREYYDWPTDEKDLHNEAWSIISEALYRLSTDRPTGDDSVFDYWPNALIAVQEVYGMFIEAETPLEIRDYFLHHFEESCGRDLTQRLIRLLSEVEATVLVEDNQYGQVAEAEATYGLQVQIRTEAEGR